MCGHGGTDKQILRKNKYFTLRCRQFVGSCRTPSYMNRPRGRKLSDQIVLVRASPAKDGTSKGLCSVVIVPMCHILYEIQVVSKTEKRKRETVAGQAGQAG